MVHEVLARRARPRGGPVAQPGRGADARERRGVPRKTWPSCKKSTACAWRRSSIASRNVSCGRWRSTACAPWSSRPWKRPKDFLDTDRPCPLEEELEPFADRPSGVGLDMPPWIQRLEDELERVKTSKTALANLAENLFQVPRAALAFATLADQFKDLGKKK